MRTDDADAPHTVRGLVLRIAGTLLALVLLYVLSFGPAYYGVGYRAVRGPFQSPYGYFPDPYGAMDPPAFYAPLVTVTRGTILEKPLRRYANWWYAKAEEAASPW
jgi:hypothetical protein